VKASSDRALTADESRVDLEHLYRITQTVIYLREGLDAILASLALAIEHCQNAAAASGQTEGSSRRQQLHGEVLLQLRHRSETLKSTRFRLISLQERLKNINNIVSTSDGTIFLAAQMYGEPDTLPPTVMAARRKARQPRRTADQRAHEDRKHEDGDNRLGRHPLPSHFPGVVRVRCRPSAGLHGAGNIRILWVPDGGSSAADTGGCRRVHVAGRVKASLVDSTNSYGNGRRRSDERREQD
jgi:hypothetical protein